jgi:transposase
VVTRVAQQLGVGAESLRNWVKQAEVDSGRREGTTTAERQRIAHLEREVRELRRANEILKSAAAFMWTARLCGAGAEVEGVGVAHQAGRTSSHST